MTNDERAQLEILRAEINGKLDVIIERISNMRDEDNKLALRLKTLEDRVSVLAVKVYIGAGIVATVALIIGGLIQSGRL